MTQPRELPANSRDKRSAGAPNGQMPPGPFLARVVSHLDAKRQGSLKVELLTNTISSNDAGYEPGQLVTVRYCMPFYGVTDLDASSKNDDYAATQQSYGFWAVPPDPGSKVLVIFAEGQINQGYWIGCVQDDYMNFQVPAGSPADKASNVIQDTLTTQFKNKDLPVGEYNKLDPKGRNKGNDPDKFPRPHNPFMVNVLSKQGLIDDIIRGLTTTSSRRDIPNTVYGWNTPGPLDKRDGAPKGKYGEKGQHIEYYKSRLGGSAFTMDDGDPTLIRAGLAKDSPAKYFDLEKTPKNVSKGNVGLPFNEHIRLKTRTGHQILLHNTEDLIYIGNANGSAWIELTSQGKIDIFADDSISLRSGNDVNIHADRDINYSAKRDFNINAGRDHFVTAQDNMDTKVGIDKKVFVGNKNDTWIGENNTLAVGANQNIQIKGSDTKTVTGNYSLQVAANGSVAINGEFSSKVAGNYRQTVSGAYNLNTVGDNKLTSGATTQIKSATNNKLDAGANTEIKSGGNHAETASGQIHMNSAIVASASDSADSISDTFTTPVTEDASSQVVDKDGTAIANVPVTASATRAAESAYAKWPKRVPTREPWNGHENLNPLAHVPNLTQSITSPPPAIRQVNTLVNDEADASPNINGLSGPTVANIGTVQVTDPETGQTRTVPAPQQVVLGKDEPVGQQPAAPVPVNDMQRFFLYTLMQKQGLTLTSASNAVSPGNAEAIAMAMAQIQRECGFKPQSENLNYSAKRLREVFPSRVKSDQFAQELAAAGPPAIGNTIYGGRYGNGRDEGYKYRGRGLIQLTFKGNYETYGGKAGVNVVDNPDLANDPEVANKLAVAYLTSKSINWADSSMSSLGEQFAKAVEYARQGGKETAKRVGIGQGFLQKLLNGELTPLSSLTTTPPPGSGTLEIS